MLKAMYYTALSALFCGIALVGLFKAEWLLALAACPLAIYYSNRWIQSIK